MTVKELIEALQACNLDMEIWAEGCDCTRPVSGVTPKVETWKWSGLNASVKVIATYARINTDYD